MHNGIVSTCGVTAEPTGDVKVQTKRVLASIDGLLEKAGTDKSTLLTAQYGWRICRTLKNTIPSGTNGLTDKTLRYASVSKLHSGGPIYWLRS
jgi:hypothetical protein